MSLEELLDFSSLPKTPSGPSFYEFVYGKKEEENKPKGSILDVFEYLNRPQQALGEAIGAFAHEEPVWEALGKGIKGKGKYGTPGQLLFPVSPDDEAVTAMGKQAAGLGLDILTDPTWLIGAPLVGKALGAASKVVKLKNIPYLKDVARYTLPITTQLRTFGKAAGNKIANLWESADTAASVRTAAAVKELADKAKSLGIGKDKRLLGAAREHIESGALRMGQAHPDTRVQEFARYMNEAMQKVGKEVEDFADPSGEKFKLIEPVLRMLRRDVIGEANTLKVTSAKWKQAAWDSLAGTPLPAGAPSGLAELARFIKSKLQKTNVPTGPGSISVFNKAFHKRDFQAIENYFPRLATPDFLKSLGTEQGLSKAAKDMAQANGISPFEAQKILRRLAQPRRAGNIEYARTLDMPYEMNPLEAIPRYFEQVFHRLEYARRFGVDGSVLKNLMKGTATQRVGTRAGGYKQTAGLSAADAGLIQDTVLGIPLGNEGLKRAARTIMGYQVMTKMGPLSTLLNLSQNSNTFIRDGGINFLSGVLRSMTKEGSRQGAIAYAGGIHQSLLQMMGATSKGADWWLRKTGFVKAERLNRLLAANSGIVTAERLLRQSGGKLTRGLYQRGMTMEDIPKIIGNNWKLPTEVADRLGMLASNATQHITRFKDIPLAWQSPSMRMALQFKQFIYQQTRFLFKDVVKPGLEYFNSNGKKGEIGPLLRAIAAFGLGGQFTTHVRDQAKDVLGYVTGTEYEPREAVPDDWTMRILEDAFNMGGLGIAGDLVEQAARRDLKGWVLGPAYGDAFSVLELMAGQGKRTYQEKGIDLAAIGSQLIKQVPMVSPLIPKQNFKRNVQEKLGSLEMLLYGQ